MKNLKIASVAVLVVASMAMAAFQGGRVRSVIGDVEIQKKGKAKWQHLIVNAKIRDNNVIKTQAESSTQIALPDGSVISIGEKAIVDFSKVEIDENQHVTEIGIEKGMLRFDAQKQRSQSTFKFKTGTATASIRGTDGTIGLTESGQPYGALNTGLMVMEQDGQEIPVQANQFVAFRKDKPPVVVAAKNASDPEFVQKLGAAIDDTTKSDEAIMSEAKALDEKVEARNEDLKSKYKCEIDSIPSVVSTDNITVGVTCTAGVRVSVGAESDSSIGKKLNFNPSWDKSVFGAKKFQVNCSVNGNIFECGHIAFTYRIDRKVSLTSSDESKCLANYVVTGYKGNKGSLSIYRDDSLMSSVVKDRDGKGSFGLLPGTHSYRLVPENADSAVAAELTVEQRLSCSPVNCVGIVIRGGERENVKRKVSQSASIYPEIKFDVLNVPGNDTTQVTEVIVEVDGQRFVAEHIPSKYGLGYKAKVHILHGKSKVVKVGVTMRSGETATATKTYNFD